MTKTLSTMLSLSLVSLAACGTVEQVAGDESPDDVADFDLALESADDGTPDVDDPADPPQAPPAILLEDPRPATTQMALSSVGFANHGALLGLIRGDATARDVSEQRIITAIEEPITLRIAFTAPTVTATRTIATDMGEKGPVLGDQPRCSTNNDTILLAEPRCNRDPLAPVTATTTTVSTTAQWNVWVLDEKSGTKVEGCITGAGTLDCVLPAGAGAAYRIVTSVNRVSELWNGTAIDIVRQQGREFLGQFFMANYCEFYTLIGGNSYCTTRYEYQRPRGLDAASLSFGTIAVSFTANEHAYGDALPNVTWNAGAEDFPGPTY